MRHALPALLVLAALWAGTGDVRAAETEAELAARVRAAYVDRGVDGVRAVAATTRMDLWLVVERLAAEDAGEIAEALAAVAPDPRLYARLPAYATWRGDHPLAPGVLDRLPDLAALRRAGRIDEALTRTDALAADADGVTRVRLLRLRALLLEDLGRSAEEILQAHRAAAESADALGWTVAALRTYRRALDVAERSDLPETVLELTRALIPITREASATAFEHEAWRASARAHRAGGRYEEALAAAEAALASATTKVRRRDALRDLLVLLTKTRRLHEALRRTQELRDLERELGDESGVMGCEVRLASLEASMDRLTSALARIQQALAFFEEHGSAAELRGAHLNAAKIWLDLRDGARSREHLRRAREVGAGLGFEDGTLEMIEGAAFHMEGLGRKAAEAYRRALPYLEREPRPRRISAHLALAVVLAGLGEARDAHAEMGRARALLAEETDALTRLYVEATECTVRLAAGDARGALAAGERARRLGRSQPVGPWHALLETRLGSAYLALGEPRPALACADRAIRTILAGGATLPDEIGAQHRAELSACFAVGIEAAAAAADPAGLFRVAEQERAVALRTRMSAGEIVQQTLEPELRDTELRLEEEEREAVRTYRGALDTDDAKRLRDAFATLGAARDAVERHRERIRTRQALAGHVLHPAVDGLETARERLNEDEALVLYAAGGRNLWAMVATREEARLVPLGRRADVETRVRNAVFEDPHTPADGVRASLVGALVEPLALPAAARRVLVVPFGELAWIPFPTLLGDREVVLLPSVTVARMLAERAEGDSTRVLAVGARGGTFGTPLPAAAEEARAVGDVVRTDEDATEENLRRDLERGPWRAVHLACHGLLDPLRPLRSALALEPSEGRDGLLTVSEVLGTSVRADLVVLSACSTGRDGRFRREGGVGFVHAFFVAGAKRVLVSLWNVDDRATAELMKRFYAAWTPGTSAATALHRAQQALRSDERFAHPAYWAGWVLWGVP